MKFKIVFLTLLFFSISNGQNSLSEEIFSKFYFSVLGGSNFNTLPTAGTAISFEVKSNISSSINAKFSIGYSTLFDDSFYEVKTYGYINIDDYEQYITGLNQVDRIRYSIIPINVGVEYIITRSKLSPFALFEVGYNYSSSLTEGTTHSGIAGYYDTFDEIPEEYRQTAPSLNDGSSISLGIGLGIRYRLTERMDVNIRYLYRYNETIVNNNQVLIGFTF